MQHANVACLGATTSSIMAAATADSLGVRATVLCPATLEVVSASSAARDTMAAAFAAPGGRPCGGMQIFVKTLPVSCLPTNS